MDFVLDDPTQEMSAEAPTAPYVPSTLGQRFLSSAAASATGSLADLEQYYARQERDAGPMHTGPLGTGAVVPDWQEPRLPAADINQRFPDLKVNEPLPLSVAKDMATSSQNAARQKQILQRYPSGFGNSVLGLGSDAVAGLLDPVGDAAFTVPVIGEARYATWLARAGEAAGLAGRAGVTLGVGAARGAAGQAILSAGKVALSDQGIGDYDLGDAAHDMLWAPLAAGVLHAGLSFHGDILGHRFAESAEGAEAGQAATHDAAMRTAAAQATAGDPVDVLPVFDAAKSRRDLMNSTALADNPAYIKSELPTAGDPEAATRLDNAVARASGAPSEEQVASQHAVEAARTFDPQADMQDQLGEAERQVGALREQGRIAPEDDAHLQQFEDQQPQDHAALDAREAAIDARLEAEHHAVFQELTNEGLTSKDATRAEPAPAVDHPEGSGAAGDRDGSKGSAAATGTGPAGDNPAAGEPGSAGRPERPASVAASDVNLSREQMANAREQAASCLANGEI